MEAVRAAIATALEAHGPDVTRPALLGCVLDAGCADPGARCPEGLLAPGGGPRNPPDLDELRRLSRQATLALDPRDRGIVDLSLRQGLQGEELSEALRVAPGLASAATQSALERTEQVVGAVLLSRVAHEDCAGLADLLSVRGPEPDPGRLAAEVIEHLRVCAPCGDRRRALVSVTSLLAAVPSTPAPTDLRRLRGRFQPSLRPSRPHPRRRSAQVAAAVLAAAAVVVAAVVVVRRDGEPTLSTEPTGGRLVVSGVGEVGSAAEVARLDFGRTGDNASFELANSGPAPLVFEARSGDPWLDIVDGTGTLPAGGRAAVRVILDRSRAPEGDITSQVRVTSTGGSGVVPIRAEVDREPVLSRLAATPDLVAAAGCTGATPAQVRVNIVEESGMAQVILHWRAGERGAESTAVMSREEQSSYRGSLGPFPKPGDVRWWVSVRDARDNTTVSPPETLRVGGC